MPSLFPKPNIPEVKAPVPSVAATAPAPVKEEEAPEVGPFLSVVSTAHNKYNVVAVYMKDAKVSRTEIRNLLNKEKIAEPMSKTAAWDLFRKICVEEILYVDARKREVVKASKETK